MARPIEVGDIVVDFHNPSVPGKVLIPPVVHEGETLVKWLRDGHPETWTWSRFLTHFDEIITIAQKDVIALKKLMKEAQAL